jgi:hypothetical protein
MSTMHVNISTIIKRGQSNAIYSKLLNADTITTIIMGSMRMVVLKWKLSSHKSNLLKDGKTVLNGLIKMLEK